MGKGHFSNKLLTCAEVLAPYIKRLILIILRVRYVHIPWATFVCDGLNLFQIFWALYIPFEHNHTTITFLKNLYIYIVRNEHTLKV